MGKLWDALKNADRAGGSDYVADYDENFQPPPEDYAGDYQIAVPQSMAEEFRKLMTLVGKIGRQSDKDFKLLLVTGPSFGVGASTVAVSMAASVANDKRNKKVLMLDLNLREPALHDIFNISISPGAVEVVVDYEKRMEFFRASPLRMVPNLHIMTAGSVNLVSDNPVEMLEHEHMKSFLKEIRGFYDLVIIDCAPVNPFSDAASLALEVDGSILVVDSDSTRQEVAKHACDRLEFAGGNLLGVVLNKRKMVIPKAIYKRL